MKGFSIKTASGTLIRFAYYLEEAVVTVKAFDAALPFSRMMPHARYSGQEFWTDQAPRLDIIQENASVFVKSGEVVIGPLRPMRCRTAGCMGIYYGEGKGLDACNIFARVYDEDAVLLKSLGEQVWKKGQQELFFERLS